MAFEYSNNPTLPDSGPPPSIMIPAHGPRDAGLPPAAVKRLEMIDTRAEDSRSLWLPGSDRLQELRLERQHKEGRIKQLKMPMVSGGHGLSESDVQVKDARASLDRLNAEFARLTIQTEARKQIMDARGQLRQRVRDWLTAGRPPGTMIVEAPTHDPRGVLKKGETLTDGVTRLRTRWQGLQVEIATTKSAPMFAADVTAKLVAEIEARAAAAAPDVARCFRHDGADIGWPVTTERLELVAASEKPIFGYAIGEVPDTLGLMMWLHKDAFIAAIKREVAAASDDRRAMTPRERAMRIGERETEKLLVERQSCCLIERAYADGAAIEYQGDENILALLGIELVITDSAPSPGPSNQHVIEVIR